jgi:NAD-dependent deacetylase
VFEEKLASRLAKDIAGAHGTVVALSGAGMSIESGIASFRGPGGLWEKYDPEEYGHITTLRNAPQKAWIMLREMHREIAKARPNRGHVALAELENMGCLSTIITQNVDGLHHVAGSRDVIEFHGNLLNIVCMDCGFSLPSGEVSLDTIPPRCRKCGGPVKPDAVFFGEAIPPDALMRAHEESSRCRLMLVIGTSAMVQPAASMPQVAKRSGALVVEINPSPTPLTGTVSDYIIKGSSGAVLEVLAEKVRALKDDGRR